MLTDTRIQLSGKSDTINLALLTVDFKITGKSLSSTEAVKSQEIFGKLLAVKTQKF